MPYGDRVVLTRTLYTVKDDQLQKMGPRVERAVQDAIYRLGRETRDLARSYCPKKTGALMASIYVTQPGQAQGDLVKSPFTRQTTAGYFRAVNAAIKRSKGALDLSDPEFVGGTDKRPSRTQRPLKAHVDIGTFKTAVERIRGIGYRTYSAGAKGGDFADIEGDVHVTQSIMEMGHAGRSSFFVTVGAAAFYAGYVEFGHVGGQGWVEGRPFMTPAVNWAKSRLPEVVKRAMEEGMRR